ncbi:TetR family transcriptional regulator [Paenibacillus antri]|uniref:TetR family transcriptional regulator n=1 Tax=Paenibacillus antri TaxID=2582848 RepID=A0A5R9G798_9BACL|nr:TetR/AcrR family transcriptional regulator C-terminal domain-containing protein [Paenibacillus antri]TLS49318.1 TetR family transcriptional regulator [Paenibacillus antri]
MAKRTSDSEKLDLSVIVQTAMALLQEEGVEKLTIRRLAQALNIKGASLYWYIRDKHELMSLMGEEICKGIAFPDENLPWEEQLLEFSGRCRTTYLEIRDSVHVLVQTPPTTPYRLHLITKVNGMLEKAGFAGRDLFSAGWMLNNYICSFLLDEYRVTLMDRNESTPVPDMEHEFYFGVQVLIKGFRNMGGKD